MTVICFSSDVPGKPEGPISHKDMMGDSLTLTWKPPKDDGGSEITNYIVEKRPVGSSKYVCHCFCTNRNPVCPKSENQMAYVSCFLSTDGIRPALSPPPVTNEFL